VFFSERNPAGSLRREILGFFVFVSTLFCKLIEQIWVRRVTIAVNLRRKGGCFCYFYT
jgi:hypothetical protein